MRILIFLLMFLIPSTAFAAITVINELGTAGAPVSAGACSGAATEIFPTGITTNWSLLPEGGDIRCSLRGTPDATASPAPTATVGFLFKSNVLVPGTTLNLGSGVSKLGLDCCGVAGAVSVDTWRE
jgi:hypothetical protein